MHQSICIYRLIRVMGHTCRLPISRFLRVKEGAPSLVLPQAPETLGSLRHWEEEEDIEEAELIVDASDNDE